MKMLRHPALPLILVQTLSSMRDVPQFVFFLIYLQEQIGLTPILISSVVAGQQLASAVVALFGGAITARLGSKWVLAIGLALAGLSSFVFQTHAVWLLVVLWLISGAGGAMLNVGGSSYLTQLGGRGALGTLSAFYALSMTIGGAVGNPIVGFVAEERGYSALGWAVMGVSIIALTLLLWLMPNLNAPTAATPDLPADLAMAAPAPRLTRQLLLGMRCLPTLFYGMLTVLVPLVLNEISGSKVTVAAYGTSTLVVASVAQLMAGRAADRWGARGPTLLAYAVLVLSGLGLALNSQSVAGLFGFGVMGISAAWALSALMFVWVTDGIPKPHHPSMFGTLHAVWSLSMMGGSLIGSWLMGLGAALPFLVLGLLNVGSVFLALAYYKKPNFDSAVGIRHWH
ncbi:MAG: MFS transporter [Anaerolineae bacterium]|nr:MFS transporter [Anaerolineae bacterium]